MGFQSLEQRMAQTYLDTFPEFMPSEDGLGIDEQRDFYQLMKSVYQLAFNEPELFVTVIHEDDAHPYRFNKSSYGKPELRKNMCLFTKAVDELLTVMYQMGIDRTIVKCSKRQRVILERLGIRETDALPAPWIWMSTREGANLLAFSRCLFKTDYPYPSNVFARLLGDVDAFHRLEKWLTERGYMQYFYLNGQMSMDFANLSWDINPPRGGFDSKIRHTGISVRYDELVKEPQVLGLCIPNGMRDYLEAFDRMDAHLQEFVVACTKKCDSCRFCLQTDKTGKRAKAYIPVTHHSTTYQLCSYFPGYSYCWSSINEALADNLIAMMLFMDSFLHKY